MVCYGIFWSGQWSCVKRIVIIKDRLHLIILVLVAVIVIIIIIVVVIFVIIIISAIVVVYYSCYSFLNINFELYVLLSYLFSKVGSSL